MTAKEKAIEITDKYKPHVTTWDCYWDEPRKQKHILIDAKKCALICVGEMLNMLDRMNSGLIGITTTIGQTPDEQIKYWKEVKQEIEKL